jgi:hypothetical protein
LTTNDIHIVDWGEAEAEPVDVEALVVDPRFVW